MAPLSIPSTVFSRAHNATFFDFAAAKTQWIDPTDVLTVLMIIGGDIVQRALASMAGSRHAIPFAPVAFSFGWVSYAFSAILAAVGSRRLLPQPDYDCTLVNAQSGHARRNHSFSLARLVRDHEPQEQTGGLTVEFFHTIPEKPTGYFDTDWVYIFSILVILVQLALSLIPAIFYHRYMVFILTLGGTILALLTAALPQWRAEKWAAREAPPNTRTVVCLTAGNGSHSVMVIISDRGGLKLEDLAAGRLTPSLWTSIAAVGLALLWIVHLITVQGLQTDSWFSLGIGALGMVQNAVAAGAKRSAGALGFHLRRDDTKSFYADKVFKALQKAEGIEPHVGLALIPVFFPGGLRADEIAWRDERKTSLADESSLTDGSGEFEEASVTLERTNSCDEQTAASSEDGMSYVECAAHDGDLAPPPYARTIPSRLHTINREKRSIRYWRR